MSIVNIRYPFLLKCTNYDALKAALLPQKAHFDNFTMWGIGGYAFGYFEGQAQDKARMCTLLETLPTAIVCLYQPGQMAVMYDNPGCVRERKDGLTYRVFAAKLKPGCADEYKRRHMTIPPLASDQPAYESNWGIWLGDGHVFGYCECDPALWTEPTEEIKELTIQWETAQLEIMEWLSDDMDWLTGQKHAAVMQIL